LRFLERSGIRDVENALAAGRSNQNRRDARDPTSGPHHGECRRSDEGAHQKFTATEAEYRRVIGTVHESLRLNVETPLKFTSGSAPPYFVQTLRLCPATVTVARSMKRLARATGRSYDADTSRSLRKSAFWMWRNVCDANERTSTSSGFAAGSTVCQDTRA